MLLPFKAYIAEWKTFSENRIIKATTKFLETPNWSSQLSAQRALKQAFNSCNAWHSLTKEEFACAIDELKCYAKLEAAGIDRAVKVTATNMMWTRHILNYGPLAIEFKKNVASALENDPEVFRQCATTGKVSTYNDSKPTPDKLFGGNLHAEISLTDPYPHPLIFRKLAILEPPMTLPEDSLELENFGKVFGSQKKWVRAVREVNQRMARSIDHGLRAFIPFDLGHLQSVNSNTHRWLPADIYVNPDGTVKIRSYINNLHPQVLINLKHPRDLHGCINLEDYVCLYKEGCTGQICQPKYDNDGYESQYASEKDSDWDNGGKAVDFADNDGGHFTRYHDKYYTEENLSDSEFCWNRDYRGTFCYDSDNSEDSYISEAEYDEWHHYPKIPKLNLQLFVEPRRPPIPTSPCDCNFQVVVKMFDIYLMEEVPEYDDCDWHLDGGNSDQTVATASYCYETKAIKHVEMEFCETIQRKDCPMDSTRRAINF
ncbi:hypothetical protein GGF37_000462 [Kickxella alabastrina]|nr:hypothetical protein GGF37_000462 [Kickxella alabastrina]